jgi:polar amino acid transport system substrate-binding protein
MGSTVAVRFVAALLTTIALLLQLSPALAQQAPPVVMAPPDLARAGTLTFCSSLANPPGEYTESDGQTPTGITVDVMKALGALMGLKVRILNFQFSTLLAAIDSGKCDSAMGGLGNTPLRRQRYNLVDYWQVASGLMVKSGNPLKLTTIEDLSGKRVAVQLGGRNASLVKDISEKLEADGKKPIDIRLLPSNVSAFHDLDLGRVDAMVADAVAMHFFASHSSGKFQVAATPIPPSTWAIVVPKANTALAAALQRGISALYENGQMRAIVTQWGVQDGVVMCGGERTCRDGATHEVH